MPKFTVGTGPFHLPDTYHTHQTCHMNTQRVASFRSFLVAACTGLLLGACGGPAVQGDGQLRTERRDVADFQRIDLSLPAEVQVRQGAAFAVQVEAEQNLLASIETELVGTTLQIKSRSNINPTQGIRLTLTMPELRGIITSGPGDVAVKDIFSPQDLTLETSGPGNISGRFIAGKVSAEVSGPGTITLQGSAGELQAAVSGPGNLYAEGLTAKRVRAEVSGPGDISCHAQDELLAEVSGPGNIVYRGNPAKLTQDVSGPGSVKKL